jgi:hypothetical protein
VEPNAWFVVRGDAGQGLGTRWHDETSGLGRLACEHGRKRQWIRICVIITMCCAARLAFERKFFLVSVLYIVYEYTCEYLSRLI